MDYNSRVLQNTKSMYPSRLTMAAGALFQPNLILGNTENHNNFPHSSRRPHISGKFAIKNLIFCTSMPNYFCHSCQVHLSKGIHLFSGNRRMRSSLPTMPALYAIVNSLKKFVFVVSWLDWWRKRSPWTSKLVCGPKCGCEWGPWTYSDWCTVSVTSLWAFSE